MKKIVYEIYPLSFKDTTGNGRGDLQGVISKLGYLKKLGVDYLWLTPIFKTPFKDNGYDIADYYQVDKSFGNNEDLKELIQKADKYDLKIMLDMVFNHTSIEHHWFKGWINNQPEYKDFYISRYSEGKPPTNWISKFGGSAWKEYKPNNWYLHLFDETQADLNWDNPRVRREVAKVVKHFIELGVKGFRFDVINLISKTEFKDDLEGDGRKYYTDGKNAHKYIRELSSNFPDDVEFLTVGELSSTTVEDTIQYANENRTELDSVFTFHHLKVDYDGLNKFVDKKPDIKKLHSIMKTWFENIDSAGSKMATFLNNHDQPRSVSRFIEKEYRVLGAKMLFAFTSSLPGIPYIFQGEEIGMENVDFEKQSDFKDVETLNYFKINKIKDIPNGVYQKSRDNSRTPMQWDASPNSGFTDGEPWIKVNNNYKLINVEREIKDKNSIFNFYKGYIEFIKNDPIQINGGVKFHEFKNDVISYSRLYKGKEQKCMFSFSSKTQKIKTDGKVLWNNYEEFNNGELKPYQLLIMEV